MKVFLLYRDRDFDIQGKLPPNEKALSQDLELNTLFRAMAGGSELVYDVARKVILSGISDIDAMDVIQYRQNVLKDCLNNPDIIREIFTISTETIENRRKHFWSIFDHSPQSILHSSVELMQMLVDMLKQLRKIAEEHDNKFQSTGFKVFFSMLRKELDNEYFEKIQEHLRELRFHKGVLISAELDRGNVGVNHTLRKDYGNKPGWLHQIFGPRTPVYTFCIDGRDEAGGRALSELVNRGVNNVANALSQSAEHILSFFTMLRQESAFYVGCVNLFKELSLVGEPISFPIAETAEKRSCSFSGLYDICLALTMKRPIVGNDMKADGKDAVIITGANQGGKSTFLRSLGLAQLMMQCGMFVPAESWRSSICSGIFTHYKREEDATMKSGKLDEELGRISEILDCIKPDSNLLLNESFAATNEIEGSEIARQIVSALVERGVRIFFVTHLFEFSHNFFLRGHANTLFLRAEREADGKRTYRITEGEPLQTSYGEDLYYEIFGRDNQEHGYRE